MNPETILDQLGIAFERLEHEPLFSFTEAETFAQANPGGHTKNLFLRNDKGDRHILVAIEGHKRCDLKALQTKLGETKLSFASPERLERFLQVKPGSVSLLTLIHESSRPVRVIVDQSLREFEHVYMHPNLNTATLKLRAADLQKFLDWTGNTVEWMEL